VTCRWDRDAERHLTREHRADCVSVACPGCLPCTHDQHGNPVRHCRTRRRCNAHLDWDEYACPTCLGKIRANLTAIVIGLALMPEEAEERGINSEPANLAGPHADYVTATWRLINARRNGVEVEELDENDPYTCLTKHERGLREWFGHDDVVLVSATVSKAADYLAWVLTDLARDETMAPVLPDLLADTARLRDHIESEARTRPVQTRGAPCPRCAEEGKAPQRLVRHLGHWCMKPGCTQTHYLDDTGDTWVCPVDREHTWTQKDYSAYVETRQKARA